MYLHACKDDWHIRQYLIHLKQISYVKQAFNGVAHGQEIYIYSENNNIAYIMSTTCIEQAKTLSVFVIGKPY